MAEDALLTCETLRKGQERLGRRADRLDASLREGLAPSRLMTPGLREEVAALGGAPLERLEATCQLARRLRALEPAAEEGRRLRHEAADMRQTEERRGLELAAVQGQIDALTKLVRERLNVPQPK